MKNNNEKYRAVSWWLTWDDFAWPDRALVDKIEKRADNAAESGVNCVVVFGSHFRWDFMPLWSRLHDMLGFTAGQLHSRGISIFDHHSSVLTHRPRDNDQAWEIWRRNRHHVPFYPAPREAASWTFNGSKLNDWRMIDVETGEPLFLPQYTAESFCFNNSEYLSAYREYVKMLVAETGIDGLMSDDGTYFGGWRSCGCRWCRDRFMKEYGLEIPPVNDSAFWGNRSNEAFRDYIDFRFNCVKDRMRTVREVLPEGFPLMSCCSSSESAFAPRNGLSYQSMIEYCNTIMLEMCGSTPSLEGAWDSHISSQLLHLSIARDHDASCFGLGYGFFPDTAFFVWAFNKFLGSDTWFSTLKGRLGLPYEEIAFLQDDSELVREGYSWEKARPDLFAGTADTRVAVLFSRATRDYYGQIPADYVSDYSETCLQLLRDNTDCEVVTSIPSLDDWPVLALSSVICIEEKDREMLDAYINSGGLVVASGPTGTHDGCGNPAGNQWLEKYGIIQEIEEPERPLGYPPFREPDASVAKVSGEYGGKPVAHDQWVRHEAGQGVLCWRPARAKEIRVSDVIRDLMPETCEESGLVVFETPVGWRLRRFRAGERILIHGLPAKVETILHDTIRNQFIDQGIIEKLVYPDKSPELTLRFNKQCGSITLHSPDLDRSRIIHEKVTGDVTLHLDGIRRYFILECFLDPSRRDSM